MRCLRVLFVTGRVPGAGPRGDQVRARAHLVELARRHRITLLTVGDQERRRDEWLQQICENVVYVPHDWLAAGIGAVRSLASGVPLQVAAFSTLRLMAAAQQLLAGTAFDLVHLQLARLGPLAECVPPEIPVTVDFVDALSVNMQRRAALDRWPLSAIARREARLLGNYEQKLAEFVAGSCAASNSDRAYLGGESKVHQVANGVDVSAFAFVPPIARPATFSVVFVGNLGYFPNVDAICWFVDAVWPRVKQHFGDVTLQLVGARPHRRLLALASRENSISLVGPVDIVQPILAAATVAIAPLRAGSGQQLKVLEAMACGTPIVASRMAADAVQACDGQHLLIADDAVTFANQVVRLLSDRSLRSRLAAEAHRFVTMNFTWQRSAIALEKLWVETARAREV